MNKSIILSIMLIIVFGEISSIKAQTASTSDYLLIQPVADRNVPFNISETGMERSVNWGLDLAWLSEGNIRRGVRFMGSDVVEIIRSSFMPTDTIADGKLTGTALTNTNLRLDIIEKWLNPDIKVSLNCDHPSVNSWYLHNAAHWSEMIDVTAKYHEDRGYKVITASPFNEPDYSVTGQGTMEDFYNIVVEMNKNSRFDSIRISGGNTLNNDVALEWYNYLKPAGLDEGNTHQLAGSFDTYAAFFEAVRSNGDHATADEMHNVMDAMVGLEYGLQTGIWWGTAEYARGEFCKASHGERLGYAEHRQNWTAASVYRAPDGKVQAFGGVSERQSASTSYRFISKDKAVYFDGYGPQHIYTMELPAGNLGTYQTSLHTNAEKVVNITWGEDVQPSINGRYILVNKASGMVAEVAGGSTQDGANFQQGTYSGATYQQWDVSPVDSRIGGDFSYYSIIAVHSGKSTDIYNWSLEDGGNIATWGDAKGANQQWYLEYAGDGWFYIRSRHSALCMEAYSENANIVQREKVSNDRLLWRFIPIDAIVEFDAPSAPTNFTVSANPVSIKLEWNASSESDVAGYDILRSNSSGGEYNTIARNVTTTSFIDNTTMNGISYFYKIRAVDKALNRSGYTDEVSAITTGENDLIEHLTFDNQDISDSTVNLNHGAANGCTFVEGKVGTGAISLNGTSDFIQLPENVANHDALSISVWVNWAGFNVGQHLFSFSSVEDDYLYLSPSVNGQMELGVKNNGVEQKLNATALPANKWAYLVVTLGENGTYIYLDGQLLVESITMIVKPSELSSLMNYIGINLSSKKMFEGSIDDFRIYNYQISASQISDLYNDVSTAVTDTKSIYERDLTVWPNPVNDILNVSLSFTDKKDGSILYLFDLKGRLLINRVVDSNTKMELDVSNVRSGIYLLKLKNQNQVLSKKIIVQH